VWLSDTVITPSSHISLIISEISLPISGSCDDIVATSSTLSFTGVDCFFNWSITSFFALSSHLAKENGFTPAPTCLMPSSAIALVRMVVVVVPSHANLFASFAASFTNSAQRLSASFFKVIAFATATPSLVDTIT